MKSIALKNFRNLVSTGSIDLKPITLLVGANGSGKSSFLRFFPLIRQSVASRVAGSVLWYSEDFVDFGSFRETINCHDTRQSMSFSFDFGLDIDETYFSSVYPVYLHGIRTRVSHDTIFFNPSFAKLICHVNFVFDENQRRESIESIELEIADNKIVIGSNFNNEVTSIHVNGRDFLERLKDSSRNLLLSYQDSFIPEKIVIEETEYKDNLQVFPRRAKVSARSVFFSPIQLEIRNLLGQRVSDRTIERLVFDALLDIRSSESILRACQQFKLKSWANKITGWSVDTPDFKVIRDYLLGANIPSLLDFASSYLAFFAKRIKYIGPVRATAKRYYRHENLVLGEVDSQGKNLAMFLNNLQENERKSFSEWTKENFKFSVETSPIGDHISLKIKEEYNPAEVNLTDTGFGFSQLLPILTQIWHSIYSESEARKKLLILAIEQPELHLHPKLQGFLVDAIIRSIEIANDRDLELKFILETHSSIFINRFGHYISEKKLDRNTVNVVLFENSKTVDSASVTATSYDDKGFLERWPIGFLEPDFI